MELFERTIQDLRTFLSGRPCRTWPPKTDATWPAGGNRNIVLTEDMAVDLGNPNQSSLACILWTGQAGSVNDRAVTLLGPDISSGAGELPYAKIVLLEVDGFDADNTYDRYRELEEIRYRLDLKGFMLRAVSQFQREWCRISKEAVAGGLNFDVLGAELIKAYQAKPYVKAVEIIFVTSCSADIEKLKTITKDTIRIVGAMNKMAEEMDFDCAECDYQDVCDEAVELKDMRMKLKQRREQHG